MNVKADITVQFIVFSESVYNPVFHKIQKGESNIFTQQNKNMNRNGEDLMFMHQHLKQ